MKVKIKKVCGLEEFAGSLPGNKGRAFAKISPEEEHEGHVEKSKHQGLKNVMEKQTMKIAKDKLKEIIKEEIEEIIGESYGDMNDPYNPEADPDLVQREMGATSINCRDLPPSPGGRYDQMTEQQLLGTMCHASHWKVYYHAQSELRNRGYTGPFPKLLPPNQRDY